MTDGPGTAREAAEKNAQAVMSGNLAEIMGQLTPEALAQMMQLGGQGGMSPAQMPSIEGYEIAEAGSDGDSETFYVTFRSAVGTATLSARWKQVLGQWKITEIGLVSAEAGNGRNSS
jgi:hypothetical protein